MMDNTMNEFKKALMINYQNKAKKESQAQAYNRIILMINECQDYLNNIKDELNRYMLEDRL